MMPLFFSRKSDGRCALKCVDVQMKSRMTTRNDLKFRSADMARAAANDGACGCCSRWPWRRHDKVCDHGRVQKRRCMYVCCLRISLIARALG